MADERQLAEVPDPGSGDSQARPLLQLVGVSKRYDSPAEDPLWVLKDICLELSAGEAVTIVGPSGSGKSTLLNIIGTLDRPTRGRVLLAGADLAEMSDAQLAAIRNRDIGFVFQLHHLLPQCTVLENVLVPTLVAGQTDAAADRAQRLLERVGLGQRLSSRPGRLSGGERQRVAVVRALINQPKLLLADEPTGSLDRDSAANLADLLVGLNRDDGVTLIVVTHSITLAERIGLVLGLRDAALAPRGRGT